MNALEAPRAHPQIPDRYELKYLIPEGQVPAIRAAIRPFCSLDEYSAGSASGRYVIESLYLDTLGRDLYRIARERRPDRFKARIRRYGESEGASPVFLEVKKKSHGIVRKARARLASKGWRVRVEQPLAADASPAERHFRDRLERHDLQPALLVRYEREAWASTIDRYARVTFDRQLRVQPCSSFSFESDPRAWLPVDHPQALQSPVPRAVVLELKCSLDVPLWMSSLTERFNLSRRGVSKYCCGIERAFSTQALPTSLFNVCANTSR
jgi:SPX domain protein involved in polyphosphate accumulation